MKMTLSTLSVVSVLLVSVNAVYAETDNRQDTQVYQVETRLTDYTRPTSFTPTKATPVNGAIAENIMSSTQRILNKAAPFLKKGVVKPVGEEAFSAWEMVSDEGGSTHAQTAPNPLTYFVAGSASSLLTQVERGIQILNLEVDEVKIESKIFFRWTDAMTNQWAGFTDKVVSNILITSKESPKNIRALKQMAVNAWAVGEGLANKTAIDAATVINDEHWKGRQARPGKVASPISTDNGFTLTNVTPDLTLQTAEVEDDLAVDMHNFPNPMTFSEIAIVESAQNAKKPYLHRIRAKSLTENYATWELYADDSRGYEGIDKAPTSRDYFTLGTSFCLMSQLTANQMYFQKQGITIDDFRVEHQFNYQQDHFMTPAMNGHLDDVITRVIVKGKAEKTSLTDFAAQSLRMCFAGEGIQNATEMETNIYLNGELLK